MMASPGQRLRILHLPVDIGGNAQGLAAAQRALGHDAVCISLQHSPLGFNGDICLEPPPGAPLRRVRREAARAALLWRTLRRADVVHCHFGRTVLSVRPLPKAARAGADWRDLYAGLLWGRDLPLWRALGKTVAMTFYGDDIRLAGRSRERNRFSHLLLPEVAEPLAGREPGQIALLRRIERYCDLVYATNPDLIGQSGAMRFLPYSNAPAEPAPAPWPGDGPLRLLHMPTSRAVKGSDLVIAAVARLRAASLPLTLTLIENRPNAAAQAAIAAHHLLVDQLRVGWYGGVAVEAMARGRPVLAYLNPADLALVPAELAAALPIVRADPDTLQTVLRQLLLAPRESLRAIGVASQAFVARWHDPLAIARRVVADYREAAARRGS